MLREHWREEKAIIFCEFQEEMPFLQEDLRAALGATSVCYDGSLSLSKRESIVRQLAWTNAEIQSAFVAIFGRRVAWEIIFNVAKHVSYDVVLVQINSGNAGLNLQMCSRVYFTNANFNPSVELQAFSRAHRYGQTEKVRAVKLVLSGHGPLSIAQDEKERKEQGNAEDDENYVPTVRRTIDHRVLEIQQRKREVMADILDDGDLLFNGNLIASTFDSRALADSLSVVVEDANSLTRQEMMHLIMAENID